MQDVFNAKVMEEIGLIKVSMAQMGAHMGHLAEDLKDIRTAILDHPPRREIQALNEKFDRRAGEIEEQITFLKAKVEEHNTTLVRGQTILYFLNGALSVAATIIGIWMAFKK